MGSSLNSKRNKMAKGKGKKKAKNISNVYSCFEQSQIQEFKEAFEMIDANRDGFIDKDDLKSTYASLGCMTVENEKLTNMMSEASGAINFTVFLQMLADKLHGTDPEDTIVDAFKMFDPDNAGKIPKDYLGDLLTCQADRFTKDELDGMMAVAPVDAENMVDYKGLAYIITHGQQEEEPEEDEDDEDDEDDEEEEGGEE